MRGFLLMVFIALVGQAACAGNTTVVGIEQSGAVGEIGPQAIEGATEIVKFDPAMIPPGDQEPVAGTCVASTTVPGAYRCDLDGGDAAEPCFLAGGDRLICDPDPVARTYGTLVSAGSPPPPIPAPPPDRQVEFFVELAGGMTCAVHTGPEPVIIGGVSAAYECDQPYTYVLGEGNSRFGRDAPIWEAAVYTLDPATGASPSGKVPTDVSRAWIP